MPKIRPLGRANLINLRKLLGLGAGQAWLNQMLCSPANAALSARPAQTAGSV